jgi:hypothetical protein
VVLLLGIAQFPVAEIRAAADNGPSIAQPADHKLAAHLAAQSTHKNIIDNLCHGTPPGTPAWNEADLPS